MEYYAFSSTSEGEDFLREDGKERLKGITGIVAIKVGIPTNVTFTYIDKEPLMIAGAFNIGYIGTGPGGLYNILMEIGVPEEEAKKVFTENCYLAVKL